MTKAQQTLWWTKFVFLAAIRMATSPIGLRAIGVFVLLLALAAILIRGGGHSWLWLIAVTPVALVISAIVAFRWAWETASAEVAAGADGHTTRPHVYDKAKYHYNGDYPKGLPRDQAFVHTGMLVGWLIDHDMIAQEFLGQTDGFKQHKVSGAEVYKRWDGCLTSAMLTDEGNRFCASYYDDETAQYVLDYEEELGRNLPSLYHVADTWENYQIIARRIDQRYEAWKNRKGSLPP